MPEKEDRGPCPPTSYLEARGQDRVRLIPVMVTGRVRSGDGRPIVRSIGSSRLRSPKPGIALPPWTCAATATATPPRLLTTTLPPARMSSRWWRSWVAEPAVLGGQLHGRGSGQSGRPRRPPGLVAAAGADRPVRPQSADQSSCTLAFPPGVCWRLGPGPPETAWYARLYRGRAPQDLSVHRARIRASLRRPGSWRAFMAQPTRARAGRGAPGRRCQLEPSW